MKQLKKMRPVGYLQFGVFFVAIFAVLLSYGLLNGSDDSYYIEQLKDMPIFQWVYWRATTWQPRLVSDFLIALFQFNFHAWRVATALVATFMMVAIGSICTRKISDKHGSEVIYSVICCAFFLIFPEVLRHSVYWYTGSFNYLWPAFFMVVASSTFWCAAIDRPVANRLWMAFAAVASMLVVYMEQTAAIFLCFALLSLIIMRVQHKRITYNLILQVVCAVLNLGVYLSFGGTQIRQAAEVYWYKDFNMLSSIDKIFQGINWGNYHLLNASNALMLLFTGLLTITILKTRTGLSRIAKVVISVPPIVIVLGMLPLETVFSRIAYSNFNTAYHLKTGTIFEYALNSMYARPNDFRLGIVGLAPSVFCMTIVLFIGVCVLLTFRDKTEAILSFLLYLAALASMYSISISPTIFASGDRVFFMTDILLVLLVGLVTKELILRTDTLNKKWFYRVRLVLLFFAACYVLDEIGQGVKIGQGIIS